ncbi:MAG TPA: TIM44-like domain-containing protein [Turneriella sp.]|nr:TIM44-like domain-containing protein [Turneriella sp.]
MSRIAALSLILIFTYEAYARAGGGGSYRSSSSSSSRSSSSSSSRSSSSSSYRSSSSSGSSSYRSSSSSSSSRSYGGSSSSSYREPEYRQLPIDDLEAYSAEINLLENGRLEVREALKFKPYDKNPKHVYYRKLTSLHETQRILPGATVDGDLAHHSGPGVDMLSFRSTAPASPLLSAAIRFEADRVYFESESGLWDFNFGLTKANLGSVRIRDLPPGATAWLFDQAIGGKLIGKIAGNGGPAILASAVKLHNPRLVITGAKAPAAEAKSVIPRFAEAKVSAILTADSTIEAEWQAVAPRGAWIMPVYNARNSYIGMAKNAAGGKIERYYPDAYLEPQNPATPAGFRVLHFEKYREAEYLQLPLGHVSKTERGAEARHYASADNATYTAYTPLVVELPTERPALAQIVLCKDNWRYSWGCEPVRTILSESSQQGNRLSVNLLEPVVNAEVMLRIYLPGGTLTAPTFGKQLAHELYHFWKFGGKPAWASWTYTLFILMASIVSVILIISFTRRQKERKLALKRAMEQQKRENEILKSLREHDPEFNLEAFYRRGREIATRIQHSWSAGDMRDCRRFLSQGVYNRFRLQLKLMRELEKRRNVMADFRINNFYVLAHSRSGDFDCLAVRLEAAARDTWVAVDISEADAKKAAGSAALQSFVEIYSFMRRSSAKTEKEQPLENCSHCGTPFSSEGETNKCRSCGAVMGSGTFDWVLAEITQLSEYRGVQSPKNLPAGLSPDRIEDRASFIFWRDVITRSKGDLNYVARDATSTYLAAPPKKQLLYDIAVGAADLKSVESGEQGLKAKVMIKWSAADGKDKVVRHRRSWLHLVARDADAKSQTFADPGCPSCGAPLPETDSEKCSYCQSTIARKNSDWLIESIETTVE